MPEAVSASPTEAGLGDHAKALVDERDALAARLHAEAAERARLGEHVAALVAEKRALADDLTEERRRAARREEALAERLAADRALHEQLLTALRREIAEKDIELGRSREGVAVSIVDHVLFPSGRAALTPDGRAVIDKVARVLTTTPERPIVVEGHTDDVPIGPDLAERFPSNWELSTARATDVVRQLVARGVPPRALEAVGRADTRPVATNATEAGRRRNRRIEIILRGSSEPLPHTEAAVDDARPSRSLHDLPKTSDVTLSEDDLNTRAWETQQ